MRDEPPSDPAKVCTAVEHTLRERFHIACLRNGTTMTDVLAHFIEEYVAEEEQRAGRL
jgi:hypothetical protein